MEELINKPRVFIAHSEEDKPFIKRIEQDLRECQIITLIDTRDIRVGKPWQRAIFESGIPTCHCVLVYLTETSVKSKWVEKEIDAALIHSLGDNGVAFLPFVASLELRSRLRLDLQSLQCRVWNESNYQELLPCVVAEIWHSYLERTVNTAILSERNQRLALEIELRNAKELQKDQIFSPQEEKDFSFIISEMEKQIEVGVSVYLKHDPNNFQAYETVGEDIFKLPLIILMAELFYKGYTCFQGDLSDIRKTIFSLLAKGNYPFIITDKFRAYESNHIYINSNITTRLLTYGLLKTPIHSETDSSIDTYYYFSEKAFRFFYWLKYNDHISKLPKVVYIAHIGKEDMYKRRGYHLK